MFFLFSFPFFFRVPIERPSTGSRVSEAEGSNVVQAIQEGDAEGAVVDGLPGQSTTVQGSRTGTEDD